jgi:hypothetical protein
MKTFKLNDEYTVVCEWKKTRMAFKHVATIIRNGCEVFDTKICYQNRTWESYEFQSVLHRAIELYFKKDAQAFKDLVDGKPRDNGLGMVAGIAKLGEILCDKQEDKNAWKKRMLKAGIPEIDFPEDFDSLPEEEKQRRLDGAIKQISDPPPCCDPRLSNVTP